MLPDGLIIDPPAPYGRDEVHRACMQESARPWAGRQYGRIERARRGARARRRVARESSRRPVHGVARPGPWGIEEF